MVLSSLNISKRYFYINLLFNLGEQFETVPGLTRKNESSTLDMPQGDPNKKRDYLANIEYIY